MSKAIEELDLRTIRILYPILHKCNSEDEEKLVSIAKELEKIEEEERLLFSERMEFGKDMEVYRSFWKKKENRENYENENSQISKMKHTETELNSMYFDSYKQSKILRDRSELLKKEENSVRCKLRREREKKEKEEYNIRKIEQERATQERTKQEQEQTKQVKYQSIWLQIKQHYQSDLFNELLQIHYPEHSDLIQGGKEIDLLKVILKGQDLDKIQDVEFFFADKIYLPYNDKKRHTFIVASNGSGKSELMKYLIYQEFKHNKTGVILIDPHGDLAEQVAKLKGKSNDKLVFVSLKLNPNYTPIFNPFDVDNKNPLEVERQARDMVSSLGDVFETSFSEYMQRILFSCIYSLMMQGNKTLADLADMMRENEVERVQRIAKTLPNKRVREFFEYDFNNRQFEPTKFSIQNKISKLLDDTLFIEMITGKNTIDLMKLTNEGYKVVFDLSGISDDAKDTFGRLIVAQLKFLANSRESTEHRPSVFVYVDEFQRFVSDSINKGLAELRKFGFHFVLATQNLTQLDTDTANNVLSNTNIKIVGQNDPLTNKKMSVQIGVDDDYLNRLKRGQFYIKARSSDNAQYIEAPSSLIDNKANMSRSKWEQIKAEQLSKYYKLRATNPTATAEPSEPQREQATDEQNDPLSNFKASSSINPLDMDI